MTDRQTEIQNETSFRSLFLPTDSLAFYHKLSNLIESHTVYCNQYLPQRHPHSYKFLISTFLYWVALLVATKLTCLLSHYKKYSRFCIRRLLSHSHMVVFVMDKFWSNKCRNIFPLTPVRTLSASSRLREACFKQLYPKPKLLMFSKNIHSMHSWMLLYTLTLISSVYF